MNSRISWQQGKQFTESTDYVNLGPMKTTSRGPADVNRSADARSSWMTNTQNTGTPYSRPITAIKPRMPAQNFFSASSSLSKVDESENLSRSVFKTGLLRPSVEPDLNLTRNTEGHVVEDNPPAPTPLAAAVDKSSKKQKRQLVKPVAPDYKRILIGTVDHVIRWKKIARDADLCFLYEAIGTLDNWSVKGSAQLLFLRGELGQIIQGLFYSVDHSLPPFRTGATYSIVGKMIGSHKMMVFDAKEFPQEEKAAVQRLAFLCQRILHVAAGKLSG